MFTVCKLLIICIIQRVFRISYCDTNVSIYDVNMARLVNKTYSKICQYQTFLRLIMFIFGFVFV